MAYVTSAGDLREGSPFSLTKTFWALIYFFIHFFQALLAPLAGGSRGSDPDAQARFRSTLRGGGGGGGGGGGYPRGGPGGPGGGGPRRPMGRPNFGGGSSMPSCPSGGCCR